MMLGIYSSPTGSLILDATPLASGVAFSTNEHGFERLTAFIRLPINRSFQLYDQSGTLHVAVYADSVTAWEGRLEDIAIVPDGINITAFGYWRALSDVPYTALWSSTSVAEWQPMSETASAFAGLTLRPQRFEYDTNNRLFITLSNDITYAALDTGALYFDVPSGSARDFAIFTFDYALLLPVNFYGYAGSANTDNSSYATSWSLIGNGALQTGSASFSLGAARPRFIVGIQAAALVNTAETGDYYLRISNIRVASDAAPVYADAIARALVSYVNGINSTQLSSSTVLIQSPTLDLKDETYLDEYPADILTRLAQLGDNQTPPRVWEVGVLENQRLHLRPRGSASRTWYVDITDLELRRTIDTLHNSVYAIYQDANSTTVRTAASTDTASVARYGLTRRTSISASTTSSTQATVQRDTVLADRKAPPPNAQINFSAVYSATGARLPLWYVRSGDTIVMRNLPPSVSTTIDKIRSFRINRTDYSADDNTLSVEPEIPADTLEWMLARQDKGFGF